MRFDPKKSFGYPVLRKDSSDYVNADINTIIELIATEGSAHLYEIEYHIMIGVQEIRDAIVSRDLALVVSFFCPKTLYSESYVTQDLNGRREVDMRNIKGDLFITVEVIVSSPSFNLKSTKFHPEFLAASKNFLLHRGDLVSQALPVKLFIEREVFQSVISLFQWAPKDDMSDGTWRMGCSPDSVQIYANPKQIRLLTASQNSKEGKALLINAIFLPAIINLISQVIAGDYDENDLWFKVLEMKLQVTNDRITESSDPIELAQKLLKNPLSALNQTFMAEE